MRSGRLEPTARSLVLDLLSTLRRGSMPVRALVEAASLFGIAENGLRVGLARLLAEGMVERDGRGQYRLGPAAREVDARVGSWRKRLAQRRAWLRRSGDARRYVGVATSRGESAARAERASRRALELLGFRALAPALSVRPDNLTGGVEELRGELAGLGLAPSAIVFSLGSLDPATEERACALWDVDALAASAARLRSELDASRARLAKLAPRDAMVESFELGGRAIRRIVLDPLLPRELADEGPLAALVESALRYDATGRACWAAFLDQHGVRHRSAPADVRVGDAATALAQQATAHESRTAQGGRA